MKQNKKSTTYLDVTEFESFSDLGLAAMLVCSGFELVAIDRTNPKRAMFIFRDSEDLQKTVRSFWSSPERKYFDAVRLLKNRLYSS